MLLLIVMLLPVTGEGGTIYQWEDENGVVFFADDPQKIPEIYRKQAERKNLSEKKDASSRSPRSLIFFEQKTDQFGREKRWWQTLVKKWEKKRRDAENRVEELRLEKRELESHSMALKEKEKQRRRLRRQMEAALLRRDKAIRMLTEELPQAAREAGAPLEWLQAP